jgi:hypothetical protein
VLHPVASDGEVARLFEKLKLPGTEGEIGRDRQTCRPLRCHCKTDSQPSLHTLKVLKVSECAPRAFAVNIPEKISAFNRTEMLAPSLHLW